MSEIQSSCAYCGVGCGVSLSPKQTKAIGHDAAHFELSGDKTHPANHGHLCAKGERLLDSLIQPNVLRYPRVKSGKPIEWDSAIELIAQKFTESVQEFGPDSVAFYLSGQLLTEDYYVANKLAKGFLNTANVDTNSRLCMSSAVSAHVKAFGEDVVPGCYEDFELADVIVLIGANSAWTHPVLFQRMLKAKAANGTKIVVIDPMVTATARQSDLHLGIKPGTDALLFSGLLAFISQNNHLNQAYIDASTEGFESALQNAEQQAGDIDALAVQLGVSSASLLTFYQLFTTNKKVMTASCQGVNQSVSGTNTTNAIINCHLALGHIGQAGSGFFSLTGQPNAMGGREVGGLATQLACHMDFSQPEQKLLADFWQTGNVASKKGLAAVDLFDAMADGKIKAVWILGTNPMVSLPDTHRVKQALETCPFVVVSEITAESDTAKMADLLLPALGWSEKSGTVTNSERTISRQRAFISPKGQAKADWWALSQVAQKMGFAGFEFANSAAVFKEFAQLSVKVNHAFPHKAFSIAGLADLTDAQYDALLPTQWPVTTADQIGQVNQRVFNNGKFATLTGKAQFIAFESSEPLLADGINTVLLSSGRSRDQWHTMTRTGNIASLRASVAEPLVALHPTTLEAMGLTVGDLVSLRTPDKHASSQYTSSQPVSCQESTSEPNQNQLNSSRSTSQIPQARVIADEDMPLTLGFMSMHWSEQFSIGSGVNQAIDKRVDPVSQQPGFKCQPVSLSRCDVALQGVVFGLHDPFIPTHSQGLTSPNAGGLIWQIAHRLTQGQCYHIAYEKSEYGFAYQASQHVLQWTLTLASKQIIHVQCCVDKGRLVSLKLLSAQMVEVALEPMHLLIGQEVNSQFIKQLHQLIHAGNSPLVCACTGVSEATISDAMHQKLDQQVFDMGLNRIDFEQALDDTQTDLGCGRQCGSCNSEVRQCASKSWNNALSDFESSDLEQVEVA